MKVSNDQNNDVPQHAFNRRYQISFQELGICECGKPCKIDGGAAGTCQSDGVTCALSREIPVCEIGIFPIHGCEIVDLDGNCIGKYHNSLQ